MTDMTDLGAIMAGLALVTLAGFLGYLALKYRRLRRAYEAQARDVYDLKVNEFTHQQLIKATQEGYWFIEPSGRTLDVNPALCRILDRSREEIIAGTIYDFVDDENRKVFEEQLEKRKRGISGAYEIALQRPDGTNVICINNPAPIYDLDGKHVGSIGLWTDVSELRETTRRLEIALGEAEAANRTKSEFLANMSHELRTPLNAILGFSSVIREGVFGKLENDRYLDYINSIHDSGSHLLELINDILDLSKIEAGSLSLDAEPQDIALISKAVVTVLKPRAIGSGVMVNNQVTLGLPLICGDERRLKQILFNLLSNAIKFTPEGGAVSLSSSQSGSGELAISVSDTGIGMTQEELVVAQSRFGQVDSSLARQHEGTGLGLPLTKALIELHDGKIVIESKKGRGTTVTITFPPSRLLFEAAELPEAAGDTHREVEPVQAKK
ncbi:MAG: PAS domain-containing sensor histidine kinase [Magnetovibrionaceae bacterium]